MKGIYISDFGILAIITVAVLAAWQALEMALYGEIQPRTVDDIIATCWIAEVSAAYFLGYRRGRMH